ncbi:MAG TPA: mechanosensitive ion channel family protein [Actinomycetes bacterium]|jgi:small-conductance mechanosensitive channel
MNDLSASIHDWKLAAPIAVALTILVALIGRWLVNRIIDRVVHTFSDNSLARRLARARAMHDPDDSAEVIAERTAARARTVGALLKSVATLVIFGIAIIIVLALIGIDITPIIASAGVVGIAVGFGAQSLIKDFLTGMFMILEDQYGVGDVIDTGQATGVVEDIGLRMTKLRDENGVLWYVPNGAIARIGNKSQGWAVANVEVPVAHNEDLDEVQALLRRAAEGVADDPKWQVDVLDVPPLCSVESVTTDAVVVRVQLRTQPTRQVEVSRVLRVRIKDALDEAGISYKQ